MNDENRFPEIKPEQALKLLGALATDDELRSRVEESPSEVLASEFGIRLDPDHLPEDLRLPPKEKIAELLVVLLQEDVTGLPHGHIVYFVVHGHAVPLVEADAAD